MKLEELQAIARENVSRQMQKFRPVTSGATNDILSTVDWLIEETFKEALQEALGKVPGERVADKYGYSSEPQVDDGFNICRAETIQGITSLLPAN